MDGVGGLTSRRRQRGRVVAGGARVASGVQSTGAGGAIMASSDDPTRRERSTTRQRFGRVAARPSEYLIQLRRGRILRHGPGLSVFVWPSDSVTILPTSIQRVTFVADQITAEKVGVGVTGVAVYRVADPLLAFRLLDFSDGDAALAQLGAILRDMFIGAARRLVAALTVEQCLTRRKEGIAQELMREIQPVVAGQGRPDDATDRGWGLVIDSIEIQDVRILSEKVFADLQAPFRAALELEARRSQVERDQMVRLKQIEANERAMAAQVGSDLQAQERARQLAAAEHAVQLSRIEQRAAVQAEEARAAGALAAEQGRGEAERAQAALEAQLERAQLEAEGSAQTTRLRLETERAESELALQRRRAEREVDNLIPDQRLRYELVTATLPEIARAFARSLGPVHLTQITGAGDGKGGLGFLAEAFAQVLAVARASGVELGGLLGPRDGKSDG
jgi:flotillin